MMRAIGFTAWWAQLDRELIQSGEAPANFGEARMLYAMEHRHGQGQDQAPDIAKELKS
jgi:hypothetical protein